MGSVERFEDLEIWQLARELVREVYGMTNVEAFARDYGLKDQIRRSAVSVMNNISEGFESQTNKLFISYLSRAKTSCGETRSVIYVALDCGYISEDNFQDLYKQCLKISRKTQKLMDYLKGFESNSRIQEALVKYQS